MIRSLALHLIHQAQKEVAAPKRKRIDIANEGAHVVAGLVEVHFVKTLGETLLQRGFIEWCAGGPVAGLFHSALRAGSPHAVERRHAQRELLHPIAGEFAAFGFESMSIVAPPFTTEFMSRYPNWLDMSAPEFLLLGFQRKD